MHSSTLHGNTNTCLKQIMSVLFLGMMEESASDLALTHYAANVLASWCPHEG
uniref:Uncharacterized protein n=1 Tax=Anguilla anguilla TaxID=7936 RepID=A0A0E9RRC6_ANGAN